MSQLTGVKKYVREWCRYVNKAYNVESEKHVLLWLNETHCGALSCLYSVLLPQFFRIMIVTKVQDYLHLAVVCYLNSTGECNTDPIFRLQRVKDVSCTHDGLACIAYQIHTYPQFILFYKCSVNLMFSRMSFCLAQLKRNWHSHSGAPLFTTLLRYFSFVF